MDKNNRDDIDVFIDDLLDSTEQNMNDNFEKELLYSDLLGEYLRKIGKTTSDDYSNDIPIEFENADIDLRIKILRDSIGKDQLLDESIFYNEIFANKTVK